MSLEIRALSKAYRHQTAVQSVDLEIRRGEFFSILGPSGCGKTTLLRMLAGLETPTSGMLFHEGERVDPLPANKRPFNLVFQRYALFPHFNVWDNVGFGLRQRGTPTAEREERIRAALSLVRMDHLGDRSVTTLSGGQQQRVALARAIVNRPKVLLLDEPLSALDLKLRREMQVELLSLQKRLSHTFVLVTHDQEEALTLSDRIAVMNQGQVEQVGTPQEIYEYPKTPFVADFIGSVNALHATVRDVTSAGLVLFAGTKRSMLVRRPKDALWALPDIRIGSQVRLLLRPEKCKLLRTAPGMDQNMLEVDLKEILYQGSVTQAYLQVRELSIPDWIVTYPNTAGTAKKQLTAGDKLYLAWLPEDGYIMPIHGGD